MWIKNNYYIQTILHSSRFYFPYYVFRPFVQKTNLKPFSPWLTSTVTTLERKNIRPLDLSFKRSHHNNIYFNFENTRSETIYLSLQVSIFF